MEIDYVAQLSLEFVTSLMHDVSKQLNAKWSGEITFVTATMQSSK